MTVLLTACGGGGGGGSNPPPSGGGNPPPPPPPPTNQAPTAQAGTDQTVELPSAAALTGSGTDAETAAGSLTFAWTGPSGVTFASPSSAATSATFSAAGSYELTLTVGDGTTTTADTVLITVNAAVFPAADTDENNADHGWQRMTPATAGMDATLLAQAETHAKTGPGGEGHGIIVRRGRIVHSWGNIDVREDLKSVTKSMGGIALGLALDQNLLELTDFAKVRLPSLGTPPGSDPAATLDQITILNLATHTAGFPKLGGFHPLAVAPNTQWRYSDGGLNWLADVLTVRFNRDLAPLLDEAVWSALGLNPGANFNGDDVVWRTPPTSPPAPPEIVRGPRPENPALIYRELASGITANVNAMARVGLLFLRRGVWNGTRILSEEFVDAVQAPRSEIAGFTIFEEPKFPRATSDYGVLWWTNESGQLPNVPRDAYWAWGLHENLIVVIPSLDLVIATARPITETDTAGRTWGEFGWDGNYAVLAPFLDPIVDSVN